MNQEKIGKFIKELRIKNKLTQKEFADKYNVSYQAVSKWENGKNIPDIAILKQICDDFNVNIDELLSGEKKNKYKYLIYIGIIILILIIVLIVMHPKGFEFKTISTTCDNFTINGSIAYNKDKSSIYISNVNYCGEENIKYDRIECILYDSKDNINKEISSYTKDNSTKLTLQEYLEGAKFVIDNYASSCKNYKDNKLFIEIKAYNKDKITSYNIPLQLTSCK